MQKNSIGLKHLTLMAVLGASALVSGCASVAGARDEQVVDDVKMQLVNDWARRNNASVIWVNEPKRTRRADEPLPGQTSSKT
jgi:hypothetical protein